MPPTHSNEYFVFERLQQREQDAARRRQTAHLPELHMKDEQSMLGKLRRFLALRLSGNATQEAARKV